MNTEQIIKAAKEYAGNGFAPGGKPWAHRFTAYRDGAIMANDAAEVRIQELETALASLLDWSLFRSDWAKEGKPEQENHPITIAKRALQNK